MRPILPLLLAPFLLAGHPVSDANKDGEISLGEFIARVDIIFAKADVDFDGVLKQDEMMGLYDLQMEADAKDRFRLADVDGDERLDEAEWLSTIVRMEDVQALMGQYDMESYKDADGRVDKDSWREAMKAEQDRVERLQARAEALAGVSNAVDDPVLQTQQDGKNSAETGDGGSVSLISSWGMAEGMTPEIYRSQKILMFLYMDRDENAALTLDEWGRVGLYGN